MIIHRSRLFSVLAVTIGAFLFSGSLMLINVTPAYALGLSPPVITIPSILRGNPQHKSVTISRAPSDVGDLTIEVVPEGTFGNFIKTSDGKPVDGVTFPMMAGVNTAKYDFLVDPGKAQDGKYNVEVSFLKGLSAEALAHKTGSIVKTGVTAVLKVTVGGDQKVSYAFDRVSGQDTETGNDTTVTYIIKNTGNVDWRPEKIHFSFLNKSDMTEAATADLSGDQIPMVYAGEDDKQLSSIVSPSLPVGEYFVKATFFDKGQQVGELTSRNPFNVYPEGTLKQAGEIVSMETNQTSYVTGDKILLDTVFHNTGAIPVQATFYANEYKDGKFVDLIKGKEYRLGLDESVTMEEVLDVHDAGKYKLDGYVEFGSRKTDIKSVEFTMSWKDMFSFLDWSKPLAWIELVVLIVAICFGLYALKYKRNPFVDLKNKLIHKQPKAN